MSSALGQRRVKHRRSKAHPDEFPDQGPVEIPRAYEDLTPGAFAVWLRLHSEPTEVLRSGRVRIARVLGYSERASDEILRELARKNYLQFVKGKIGEPTEVVINRRCLITSRSGVTRLSEFLASAGVVTLLAKTITNAQNDVIAQPAVLAHRTYPEDHQEGASDVALFSFLSWIKRRLKFVSEDSYINESKKVAKSQQLEGGTIGGKESPPTHSETEREQDPDPDERSESCGLAPAAATRRGKIDLSRLREAQKSAHARSKAERATERERRATRAAAHGRTPNAMDWGKLDQLGKPVVSFDPGHPARGKLIEVLQRQPRDRVRREVVAKVGTEFSRIYERYRREAERARGAAYASYSMELAERKHCEEAGVLCLLRGVTPRQLLEYWHANIKQFTDGELIIPPLTFLKSPNNIDRVATSAIGTMARTPKADREEPSRIRPTDRNTFSGPNGLDVRLRPALERAGFQTQMYNDRYLLSIQHNAISLARGKSIFLAEGRVERMSRWAARHLYSEFRDANAS